MCPLDAQQGVGAPSPPELHGASPPRLLDGQRPCEPRTMGVILPKKIPNDDDDFDPRDLETAADEAPTDVTAPELSEQTKELTAWDEPADARGHEAPRVKPEDETSIAEQLVNEGTDEADRDRRLAAED